jgi:hypothetical protein
MYCAVVLRNVHLQTGYQASHPSAKFKKIVLVCQWTFLTATTEASLTDLSAKGLRYIL